MTEQKQDKDQTVDLSEQDLDQAAGGAGQTDKESLTGRKSGARVPGARAGG